MHNSVKKQVIWAHVRKHVFITQKIERHATI